MSFRSSSSTISRSIRVLQATDIHFLVPPTLWQVLRAPKRIIGLTNLFVLRRRWRFALEQQQKLVAEILKQKPDVLIISGDLTNMATEEEFMLARTMLHPLLDNKGAFPTFIIPGNHDAYTPGSVHSPSNNAEGHVSASRMRKYFGPWMEKLREGEKNSAADLQAQLEFSDDPQQFAKQIQKQQQHFLTIQSNPSSSSPSLSSSSSPTSSSPIPFLPVFSYDFLRIVGLNPCRPTKIGSNGSYDPRQLDALRSYLQHPPTVAQTHGEIEPWHPTDQETQELKHTQRLLERLTETTSVTTAALENASSSTPFSTTSHARKLSPSSCYHLFTGHYPVLDGRGGLYEKRHKWHGCSNNASLVSLLREQANRIKPQLFLHGHVHRGFQDQLALDASTPFPNSEEHSAHKLNAIPNADEDVSLTTEDHTRPIHQMLIVDPGSSGYVYNKDKKRTSAFCVYTLSQGRQFDADKEFQYRNNNKESSHKLTSATSLPTQEDQTVVKARTRVFPNQQPLPPFPMSPASDSAAAHSTTFVHSPFIAPKDTPGAAGGVQTVHQRSSDGEFSYYTSIERWIYNGHKYVQETFPFTSGF